MGVGRECCTVKFAVCVVSHRLWVIMDVIKDTARELEEFDEDASVSQRRMLDGKYNETFHMCLMNKTYSDLFHSTSRK